MTGFLGFASGSFSDSSHVSPFTSVDLSDEQDVLSWMRETSRQLQDYYSGYRSLYRTNIETYAGSPITDVSQVYWAGGTLGARFNSNSQLPVIQPIVEAHLARITSSRPHVSILPVHSNEYTDLIAAKTAKQLLEMSFDDRQVQNKFEEACRSMLICGHSYMLVEWDNTIGPLATNRDEAVPVLDEAGNPRVDEYDNLIMFNDHLRLGDVNYKTLFPFEVLEQPGVHFDRKDWIIRLEPCDVYKLREQYPLVADLLTGQRYALGTDDDFFEWATAGLEETVMVYHLYHRATPSFPDGRYIKCTDSVLLENTVMPYPTLNKYGELPILRLDDTRIPGYTLPMPMTVLEAGKPYQDLFNKVNRSILRNMSLSAPKWLFHSSSGVRQSHLNNMSNLVTWRGSVKPEMVSPATTPGEFFDYRTRIQEELYNNTGAANVFNKPPANTRAGVMLEHQEEQEFKRAEPLIKHMNDFMARSGRLAISIMADMYDDSDERVVKIGGGSTAKFLAFQTAELAGPFDVKFERTSALPESKQGRLNEAARLFQLGLIGAEQYKKVIGFDADPDLSETPETKAFQKQLEENDLMRKGLPVAAPEKYEDHVSHLKALYPLLQSSEFAEMPAPVQGAFKNHIMAHEMFAWQRAQVSLTYAMKVAESVDFVLFSALPEAIPVQPGIAPTPAEGMIAEKALMPGLSPMNNNFIEPAGPEAPERV